MSLALGEATAVEAFQADKHALGIVLLCELGEVHASPGFKPAHLAIKAQRALFAASSAKIR